MLCALVACSLVIYGIVMAVIPRRYSALANNRVTQETERLIAELTAADYQTAKETILRFCIENHAYAVLMTGEESINFGAIQEVEESENSFTMTAILQFSDQTPESVLAITAAASAAGEIRSTFLAMLPVIAVVILLISSVSAWLCSQRIVQPVLKISRVSKRMAQLDMTWRCETGSQDELGELAANLNGLCERLTQALSQLEAANEKLREDVALANSLERQRRDFFAAASHELKTPLTIIKGQLESMLLGIGRYRNTAQVLPETLRETERMERLVAELLAVSRMQIDSLSQKPERLELGAVLKNVAQELAPLANEKQITVNQTLEEVWIEANPLLLRKALHNILSNAIRHSPHGQKVTIILDGERLTVENTGVVLPEEEIELLFTPFYRVEKSRNQATGGSGLGLYFVKTILDFHGFAYRLCNGENSVRFIVWLCRSK